MYDIAALILFKEFPEKTIECVKSIGDIPIYILNNDSSLQSTDILNAYCDDKDNITVIPSDFNLGVGNGRNLLIQSTKEQWLLFLDNDITISENWLECLPENLDEFQAYNIPLYEGGKPTNNLRLECKFDIVTFADVALNQSTNMFKGGCSIVSRNVFDLIGLYDEKMFIGFEDLEMAVRAHFNQKP